MFMVQRIISPVTMDMHSKAMLQSAARKMAPGTALPRAVLKVTNMTTYHLSPVCLVDGLVSDFV